MNEHGAVLNIVLIVVTVYTSYRGFTDGSLLDRLIFDPYRILARKEYHRLATSAFIHADWTHLLLNMFSLYSFGSGIETVFGMPTFAAIYFGAIIGGGLLSLYLHRNHEYRALGASGGVCGVIFASIFLLPGGTVMIFPVPIPIPAWLYAVLFLLLSYYGVRSQSGRIGHDAHLGGAMVGLLIATALHPWIVPASPVLYAAVTIVSAAVFLLLLRRPLYAPWRNPFSAVYWRTLVYNLRSKIARRSAEREDEDLERFLDRISKSGVESLSSRERRRLAELSKRHARRQP